MKLVQNAILGITLSLASTALLGQTYWIKAGRGESCDHACTRSARGAPTPLKSIKAGIWPNNGNRFRVCAAQDKRPGFQLPGVNDGTCTIAWGAHGQDQASLFSCLCSDQEGAEFLGGQ